MNFVPFKTTSGPLVTSDGLNFLVPGYSPPSGGGFSMTVYYNSAEPHRLNKTEYLEQVGTLAGTLRESCSISAPVITFYSDTIPRWNYAYIETYGRYYFVDDITIIRTNLYQASLRCDVLMSFRIPILSMSAYIDRNEFNYSDMEVDEEQRFYFDRARVIKNANSLFTFDISATSSVRRYVICAQTGVPSLLGSNTYLQKSLRANAKFVCNSLQIANILENMNTQNFANGFNNIFKDNPTNGIISISAYPFDVVNFLQPSDAVLNSRVYLGTYDTGIDAYQANRAVDSKLDVPIAKISFLDRGMKWYEYNDTIVLYLPFIGFTNLNANEVYGNVLQINYGVDFDNGTVTAYLYRTNDSDKSNLFMTLSGSMGISIPYSESNAQARAQAALSLAMSAGMGAVSIATGAKLGSVVSAGAILKSSQDLVTQTSTGGGTYAGGCYAGLPASLTPYAVIYTAQPIESDVAPFLGKPLRQVLTIGSLSGFTKVSEIHTDGLNYATRPEQDEVEALFKNGVIV